MPEQAQDASVNPTITHIQGSNQNFYPAPEGHRGPTNWPPIEETVVKLSIIANKNQDAKGELVIGDTEPDGDTSDDGKDTFVTEKVAKQRLAAKAQ